MSRIDIFTHPIWHWNDLPIDNTKIANHAYILKDKDPEFRNPEGHTKYALKWKSYNLTKNDFLAFPETGKLMKMVFDLAQQCFTELNPRPSVKLAIDSVWYNIYPPGSHLEAHPHPGNVLSGTYYVKGKEDSGDLVYLNPDVSTYYTFAAKYFHERNHLTAVKYYVPPVENSLVIAPSNIVHAVKDNRSDEDRISFTFNLKVIDTDTYTPNDRYF